jgi:hypothetical protein
MADQPKPTPPPPIRLVVVDRDGRPTKEMADFMHRLWTQVQEQKKQIEELKQKLKS